MTSSTSPFDDLFLDKYNLLLLSQMMLSIEYFSTYTVKTNCAKYENFMPKEESETRGIALKGLSNMGLYAFVYSYPNLNEKVKNLRITFLENEFAEDILLCTSLIYDESYYLTGICKNLILGGASLNQLKISEQGSKYGIQNSYLPNSTVSETIRRGRLSMKEAILLSEHASAARIKLYNALAEYKKESE